MPSNPSRSRGRQPEARRNDRAVLDAARRVFAVHGPNAPVSAVAEAAGVGMGSLYRRYPSKEALLQYLCQASLEQQLTAAEEALAENDDPWAALAGYIRACVSFRAGAFASVASMIPITGAMQETARLAHERLETLVRRAQRAGALRADVGSVDIHALIEQFSRRRPDETDAHARLLAVVLDGLRALNPTPLPGSAPTWEDYAGRWVRRSPRPTSADGQST